MTIRATVLVVEDEPLLRIAGADMVEDAGFGVVEAANATEAVRILEARPDITLVFSDIDMPGGLDGVRLAAIIRNRWPPIEIILVSGHGNPETDDLPARTIFFPKPYREDEIVAAIRRLAA
jgi:CheY-like chemotaxis protein